MEHVELLLPNDAPEWAKELQKLIVKDRQKGVQELSDVAEHAEKRQDSLVYRDFEFALPRELTDEQNIAYAKEFLQDQMCQLGITVLANFHFDVDKKTGEKKPHCHAVMLTRRLTENGLSEVKELEWRQKELLLNWREQVAAYGNFHLKMHGFEASLDHRSYIERDLDIEPQTKLGYNVQEMERRAGQDVTSLDSKPITDRGLAYQAVKLRNLYRIIKRPEVIFEMITKTQSTFMWGDVQKKLAQYIDDATLFQRLDAQLQNSKELVFLRMLEKGEQREDQRHETQDLQQDRAVYTCKEMLKAEIKLVSLAESLNKRQTHKVDPAVVEQVLTKYNQKFDGGLSPDQIQAIKHMVQPNQISCVVGYAGAGKTTALEVAKEIWEKSGYAVYGLAPTGRARENLSQNSFESFTLHKFLKDYENGRCQYKANIIMVLDEGGMVSTQRLQEFLSAADKLGVKPVVIGDGAQLQPVEAGPAFRLVTERVSYAKLEYIVRQKEEWQKEATILFGQNKTREALEKYYEHGCFKVCSEKVANLDDLMQREDFRGVVMLYNLSRRVAGNIYHETLKDTQHHYFLEKDAWKYIASHIDYDLYCEWRGKRDECARVILGNLDQCRSYMKELGVDPIKFALNFVDSGLAEEQQTREAQQLVKKWQLSALDEHQKRHICDPRIGTKEQLVKDWHQFYREKPTSPRLMMSYSNNDVHYMNDQARFLLKQDGVIDKAEFVYTVHRYQDKDFGKQIVLKEDRAFAQGDRLLFTRNDRGLGVSNGTIGTIVFLDQNNIKVRLDNSEKVVSFAPKLYPHFDQGWAATIHKNQGVTVDHALVLASFEMFRNLAYVGMTRHRISVTLYASDIDFWKEEKIFDRLERSQEKLSSYDYIDAQKVYELMREDDKFLGKLFDRLGNQLEAIKYVSKRAFEEVGIHFFNKTYGYESPLSEVKGSIQEEDRAREFFKDAAHVNLSYKFIQSDQQRQTSEMSLDKGFQAQASYTYQDQSGLQQRVDKVLITATDPQPQEKMSQTLLQSCPEITHQTERSWQKQIDHPTRSQSNISHRYQPLAYYDREAVLKSISPSKAEQIFKADIHQWVNVPKESRQGIYLRYGSGKGFVINLDEKTWYSHYKGEGGDIFSYVSLSKGISYGEAIKKVGQDINAPTATYLSAEEQAKRFEAYKQEKEAQLQKDIAAGKAKAEKVYQQTQSIEGTLGEKYLNQHRGYLNAIPGDIRFCGQRYTPQGNYPALVSFARDKNGVITGYQEIFLDPLTGNKAKDLEVAKRSGGHCKGSAVRIQEGEGVTYIAEGIETALSIKAAGIKGEILSGYGRYVFKNAEPKNKTVVICADYDGKQAQTHEALLKDQQALIAKGYNAYVVWPATQGEKKLDFNDLLNEHGASYIKNLIQNQLPEKLTFSTENIILENKETTFETKNTLENQVIPERFASERSKGEAVQHRPEGTMDFATEKERVLTQTSESISSINFKILQHAYQQIKTYLEQKSIDTFAFEEGFKLDPQGTVQLQKELHRSEGDFPQLWLGKQEIYQQYAKEFECIKSYLEANKMETQDFEAYFMLDPLEAVAFQKELNKDNQEFPLYDPQQPPDSKELQQDFKEIKAFLIKQGLDADAFGQDFKLDPKGAISFQKEINGNEVGFPMLSDEKEMREQLSRDSSETKLATTTFEDNPLIKQAMEFINLLRAEEQLLTQYYELDDPDKIEIQEEKLDSLFAGIKKDEVLLSEIEKQDKDVHERIMECEPFVQSRGILLEF